MANAGPNTNSSQFFILFAPQPSLDGKHTVFGRVIHNYGIIEKIEKNETGSQDKPLKQVTIVDCGEIKENKGSSTNFVFSYANIEMNLTDMHVTKEHEDDSGSDKEEEKKTGKPAAFGM